jgi:hypothetical protein
MTKALTKATTSLLEWSCIFSARRKLIHVMSQNTDQPITRASVVGCAISATRNDLKLNMPGTLNPLLVQHSCRNAEVAEAFCECGLPPLEPMPTINPPIAR